MGKQQHGGQQGRGPGQGFGQGPGQDRGQGRRQGGGRQAARRSEDDSGFEEVVVKIYRCSTVVRGGRRFSFAALVVVGDRKGQVGVGYGKAREVPLAVEKAIKAARKNVSRVRLHGTTIPHRVIGRFGASRVALLPAGEGTGVIASASVRPVLELAGVKNVLTKSLGSTAPKNLVKATMAGLVELRDAETVQRLRGVSLGA